MNVRLKILFLFLYCGFGICPNLDAASKKNQKKVKNKKKSATKKRAKKRPVKRRKGKGKRKALSKPPLSIVPIITPAHSITRPELVRFLIFDKTGTSFLVQNKSRYADGVVVGNYWVDPGFKESTLEEGVDRVEFGVHKILESRFSKVIYAQSFNLNEDEVWVIKLDATKANIESKIDSSMTTVSVRDIFSKYSYLEKEKKGYQIDDIPLSYGTMHIIDQIWPDLEANKFVSSRRRGPRTPALFEKPADVALEIQIPSDIKILENAYPLNSTKTWKSQYRTGIFFYGSSDPYYQFTNFWKAPIVIDGETWATSENYFQAQKFKATRGTANDVYAAIQKANNPADAYKIGAKNRSLMDPSFQDDTVAMQAMYRALIAKFTQHQDLFHLLVSTEKAVLVENTAQVPPGKHDDPRWGNGKAGNGKNMLGRILMHLRDQFVEMKLKGVLE